MSTSSTYASFVERERETWPGIEAEHCHGNEHEQRQKHHPRKLIWKCVQPDSQALELQTPFDACTKCKEGKEYNKASNAAAHFKRCHLRPAIDGRGSRAPAATTVAAVVPGVSVLKDLGYLAQFEVPDTERQNTEEPSPSDPVEDFSAFNTHAGPYFGGCSAFEAFDAFDPFQGLFDVVDAIDNETADAMWQESVPTNLHMAFPDPESSYSPTEGRSSFNSEFSSLSSGSLSSGSLSCQITPAARTNIWSSMESDDTYSVPCLYHAEDQSSHEITQQSEKALSAKDCTTVASHYHDLEEPLRQKLRSLSASPDPGVHHSWYEIVIEQQHGANSDKPAVQEAGDPPKCMKQMADATYGSPLVSKDSELSTTEWIDTLKVQESSGLDPSSSIFLLSHDLQTTQGGSSCAPDTQDDHTSTTTSPYAADEQAHHVINQNSELVATPEDPKSQEPVGLVEDSAYPADSPHYSFETLSATPESASQQNAQRNPIAHRLQQLRAQYEALEESDDYDSSSDSTTETDSDINDGSNESSGTSQYTEHLTGHQNEGSAPESDSPGSSEGNVSGGQSFSGSTSSNASHNTHHHKSARNSTSEDRSGSKILQAVARSHRDKDQAEILPCPLSSVISCPGKDKDMATLERTLCTTSHGILYHHKCKRRLDDPTLTRTNDAKTLRARRKQNQEIWKAHEQEGCEEYCVVLECPTAPGAPSEDPRHKRAPNCVTSRRRKQAEYNYLCAWLLEVPARDIEAGEETKHKEQRKSPSKKNDIASESLKIGEAQVKIINELLDIIQHAREETADMQITSALRRRLQRAPQLLTESYCHHYQSTPGVMLRHTVPPTPESASNQSYTGVPRQNAPDTTQCLSQSMHDSNRTSLYQPPAKRRRVDSIPGPSNVVQPRGKVASLVPADHGAFDLPQTTMHGQQTQQLQEEAMQTRKCQPTLTTDSGVISQEYCFNPPGTSFGDTLTDIADGISYQQSTALGNCYGTSMSQWDRGFSYSQSQHDNTPNAPPVWHAKHQYLDTPNDAQLNTNPHLPFDISLDSDLGSTSHSWLGRSFTSSGQATQDYMSNG